MKYQRYPEYKNSGSPYVDNIPKHWIMEKNKRIFSLSRSLVGEKSSDFQLLSLSKKGVVKRDIESGFGKFPAEFNTYQKVDKNDLIFCLFDIDETPRTVGLSLYCGMITGAYDVFKVHGDAVPEYIFHYYLHLDSFKGLRPYYTGLRKVVRAETFASITMPLPSIAEQTQIAEFLDRETGKIDTLIAKQQQLIGLLQEKRQAVISHAVTKGLNPNAKMKNTGIQWLGNVPEHWDIVPLRFFVKTIKGFAFKSPDFCDNGIRVVRASDIKNKTIIESSVFLPLEFLNIYSKVKLSTNDLVISTVGSTPDVINSAVGQIGIVPEDINNTLLNQNTVILKPYCRAGSIYIFYVLTSTAYREHLNLHAHGTANQSSLSLEDILNYKAALPPLDEQESISTQVGHTTAKINKLLDVAKDAINLLQERRTALISAAVTGKIDVRKVGN